jgi:ankyrin repeat protein
MKGIVLVLVLSCMVPSKAACVLHMFKSKPKLSFGDKMWAVIYKSDVEVLKKFFEKTDPTSEQLNTTNPCLQTPLMWFAYTGKDLEMARLFIERGANINFQDTFKKATALIEAARQGHEKIAKLLIEHNADIDLQDYEGNFALMHALAHNHTSLAEHVIQQGADITLPNHVGQTALILASIKDNEKIVQLLLQKEPLLDHCDLQGETALGYAHVRPGSTIQILLQNAHDHRRAQVAQMLIQYIAVADLANIALDYL